MDVKTLCLGVLTLGDKTGYEIKKHFERAFSHFFVAGFGSIYPGLSELTRDGHVTVTSVTQSGRPDKKIYSLTDAGRELLMESLLNTAPRHKVRSEFVVLMYFAHLLPRERLASLLDERVRDIETMLGNIDRFERDEMPLPGRDMVAGLGRAVLEAQRDYIRAHRRRLLGGIDCCRGRAPVTTRPTGCGGHGGGRP